MKKLCMCIALLLNVINTVEPVKIKVLPSDKLQQNFKAKKIEKFMEGTKIIARLAELADKEIKSNDVTTIVHEELKDYLGSDYSPAKIEALYTFGVLPRILETVGVPLASQKFYILDDNLQLQEIWKIKTLTDCNDTQEESN